MRTFITALLLAGLLLIPSCGRGSPSSSSTTIGTITNTTSSVEQPDDIVITPGGYAYRANVHQQGVPDKWPSIESATVALADNVTVMYRAAIETPAGQTRNNIVSVRKPGVMDYLFLMVTYTDIPAGFTVSVAKQGGGLPGTSLVVLAIDIASSVQPGQYTFNIDINFDGKDYGTLPCKVAVTQS